MQVGDIVEENGVQASVVAVSTETATGLYNPHTLNGDIVVNGIKTSTYTAAVAPALAHAALWPVRMLYSAGYDVINGVFDEGSELVASMMPKGHEKY